MSRFFKTLAVGLLAASLVACGKTSEEKAQDRAKMLIAEQKKLAGEVRKMGVPQYSWSESDLAQFETKVGRLKTVEAELRKLSGTNNITIYNLNDPEVLDRLRQFAADIRAEKAKRTSTNEKIDSLRKLEAEDSKLTQQLTQMGSIDKSWGPEQLTTNKKITEELIANKNAQLQTLDQLKKQTGAASSEIEELRREIVRTLSALEVRKDLLNELIAAKSQQPSSEETGSETTTPEEIPCPKDNPNCQKSA